MMLAMMVAALGVTACGGSDDDDSYNTSGLTSEEIVGLLEGKWDVHGESRFISKENESLYSYEGNYKGTIEFEKDGSFKFKIIEYDNDEVKYTNYKDNTTKYLHYNVKSMYYLIVDDDFRYAVKKGNKNYIEFRYNDDLFDFEIVSLKPNSFKLVLNKNSPSGEKYMTMISD